MKPPPEGMSCQGGPDPSLRDAVRIGRSFCVVPPGVQGPAGLLAITLQRARAFGSGGHETTRSCLEELEDLPVPEGASCLDLGTGTGILAVAACRLGAGRILALDNDLEAAAACRANASANGMGERITPLCATLDAVGPTAVFHLILANLYGDILERLATRFAALLLPGGVALLSGIGFGDATGIRRRLADSGLELLRNRYLTEYVTMVWRKPA
ncbi:MAG: 50S ribosomal protein L11 methyltransferase [bacterium]|nr:MAG: 50S ribosomal protein L11 methyltransferase [bacterium]